MFPGFEYVPYERPVSPNVSTPQSVADPSSSAGPKQDSAHADRVAVAVVRQNVARATLQRLLSIWRNAFGLDSRLFFFQAEDGIRDYKVTGVQTCALPIYLDSARRRARRPRRLPPAESR